MSDQNEPVAVHLALGLGCTGTRTVSILFSFSSGTMSRIPLENEKRIQWTVRNSYKWPHRNTAKIPGDTRDASTENIASVAINDADLNELEQWIDKLQANIDGIDDVIYELVWRKSK